MRGGLSLGSTVAWPADVSGLNSGFFTVSRAGFQGGLVNTLTIGDRLILTLGVNSSVQTFAIRQTGLSQYKMDARFRTINLEVPFQVGFTGYLGSLRHRESVGIGLQSNLSLGSKIVQTGDSVASILPVTQILGAAKVYPVLQAAFDIGSEFENDGALYFGLCFRYGMQEVYSARLFTTAFTPQVVTYNGTYLGFGLTYYLPRYSYWFKREFIY
ncbi:MAG: hypothetical protein KDC13_08585 [Bacteroidetes bacterium]|nr:hypothetical protein [Bacteroidota bacterium]